VKQGRPLHIMIVDDEAPAVSLLEEQIDRRFELSLKAVARTGLEAGRLLRRFDIDLLFLDIHLPDMSGIDIIRHSRTKAQVVFTTAYDDYAVRAFELGAIDYLLKPISDKRFNEAVDRVITRLNSPSDTTKPNQPARIGITFREGDNYHFIAFNEVVFLESKGKRTVVHTRSRSFETPRLLHVLSARLPQNIFLRVHKQFVLNINYVSTVQHMMKGDYVAFLSDEDDTQIPVSRNFSGAFKQMLGMD